MHLTLLLPGLYWPELDADAWADIATPALGTLLSRGNRRALDLPDFDDWFAAKCGGPLPSAPLAACQAGLPGKAGYWLHADPVSLTVARDELILLDAAQFPLKAEEATELVTALNQVFSADGLTFHAPSSEHWFVQAAEAPALSTTTLALARGKHIDPLLPQGEDAMLWQRRLTEMQMLLYGHPVNDQREITGQPLVHSVWLWGGGTFPIGRHAAPPGFVDAPRWAALATLGGEISPLPSRADVLLDGPQRPEAWAWLDLLDEARAYHDVWRWREALAELEDTWFAPLWQALLMRRLTTLTLVLEQPGGLVEWTIGPSARWAFWKRPMDLKVLMTA